MTRAVALWVLVSLTALDAAGRDNKPVDRFGDPLPDGALMRLGTVRGRADIRAVGVLADGTVVTVGSKNEVRTWAPDADVSDLPIPIPLPGPQGAFTEVSPDGSRVVVANRKTVAVFERPVAAIKKLAEYAIDNTRRVVFSPDGSKLFVAWIEDRHRRLTLCDVATGKATDFDGTYEDPACMAFSGDGTRAAFADRERVVAWDVRTGRKVSDFNLERTFRLRHIALDRTGEVLVATPTWEPQKVQFFSAKDGKPVAGLTGPDPGWWADFAPDGKTILVGDAHGVTWWDPAAGKPIRRFDGATAEGPPGRLTADGKVLVACTRLAVLRWDAATGKPLFPSQDAGHWGEVVALGVSPDGKVIATSSGDGSVMAWDAATGRRLHAWPSERSWCDLPFSPDGRFLYGPPPFRRGGPRQWDVATGREVRRFEYDPAEPEQSGIHSLRPSPDGRTLTGVSTPLSYPNPGLVTVWDAATGRRRSTTRRTGEPPDVAPVESPDGRWEVRDNALVPVGGMRDENRLPANLLERFLPAAGHAFSPDSRLVALVGHDMVNFPSPKRVVVVEVATGAVVLETQGNAAAFGANGRSLAVTGVDHIAFWDVGGRKEYGRRAVAAEGLRHRHDTIANGVRFVPDGTKVVTAHADTTALIWPAPPRPKAKPLGDAGRGAAWEALLDTDAGKGWAAVWALADDPAAAAFLQGKVKAVKSVDKIPTGEALRAIRAVAALELNGDATSRTVLADLAAGPEGEVAADAKRALDRLRK